ncbi:MAG TPA: hypothetical protein VM049_05025, partial [Gaiellaceae bacterium]|nr:hypothetical protein [Gaiellaceae bacterium]
MATTQQSSSIPRDDIRGMKLVLGYGVVSAFLVVAIVFSVAKGRDEQAPTPIAGFYTSNSSCLGEKFKAVQSGQFVDVSEGATGKLRVRDGQLSGDVDCITGDSAPVALAVGGAGDKTTLSGTVAGDPVNATFAEALPEPGASTKKPKKRSGEETFGRLMLAIAAVILAARLVGTLIARFHQPRVMGEVLAGILLGPTLLGAVWPEA